MQEDTVIHSALKFLEGRSFFSFLSFKPSPELVYIPVYKSWYDTYFLDNCMNGFIFIFMRWNLLLCLMPF